jgi:hypothetical protein
VPNIRHTRFGSPQPRVPQPEVREEIFEPTLGLDAGQAPQELLKGFTPFSQNWVRDGGYLTPRSGMSQYDATFTLGGPVIGGIEAYDVDGFRNAVVASAQTFGYLGANSPSWRTLTFVGSETPNAPMRGWDAAYIYDSSRDKNVALLTDHTKLPKFVVLGSDTTQVSDWTHCASTFSRAKSVAAFDNRLVFFNTASSVSEFPQRIEYTARGVVSDHATADGAGFIDVMDMRGIGQKVIPYSDSLLFFTEREIWLGRNRRDDYFLDMIRISDADGCPFPKTIAQTPEGIVFLRHDLEVCLLSGTQVIPLGPTNRKPPEIGDASRIQRWLQDRLLNGELAHATYNSRMRRYELRFTSNTTNTNLYPESGLYYDFNNQSWFPQTYPWEVSCAFEMQDTDAAATWDSIPYTWDQYNVAWDDGEVEASARRVVTFSSNGTPYRFRSDQTTDAGTAIVARWRSHALNSRDALRYDQLYEVQVEYANASSSSASVWVSENLGSSFIDSIAVDLSQTSHKAALVPVNCSALAPTFEVRSSDGGQPKISRFYARLRDQGLYGGAA